MQIKITKGYLSNASIDTNCNPLFAWILYTYRWGRVLPYRCSWDHSALPLSSPWECLVSYGSLCYRHDMAYWSLFKSQGTITLLPVRPQILLKHRPKKSDHGSRKDNWLSNAATEQTFIVVVRERESNMAFPPRRSHGKRGDIKKETLAVVW